MKRRYAVVECESLEEAKKEATGKLFDRLIVEEGAFDGDLDPVEPAYFLRFRTGLLRQALEAIIRPDNRNKTSRLDSPLVFLQFSRLKILWE